MQSIRRHHVTITILILLLSGAIALNWFLFKQAETYYIQLNATRLSPLSLHAFANEPQISTIQQEKTVVALFGDSRAAQWPTADSDQFAFINRGIGAQTSIQVSYRYRAHVKPNQPDIVLLQVGINDLKTIGLFPDDERLIVRNVKKSINRIVREATSNGSLVILTTIFPTGKIPLERRPFWSANIDTAVINVNDHIHSMQTENVIIFDSYALLVDENGRLREAFAADELHLNQAGYKMLNDELSSVLGRVQK